MVDKKYIDENNFQKLSMNEIQSAQKIPTNIMIEEPIEKIK
jgi:hypothetical protein